MKGKTHITDDGGVRYAEDLTLVVITDFTVPIDNSRVQATESFQPLQQSNGGKARSQWEKVAREHKMLMARR